MKKIVTVFSIGILLYNQLVGQEIPPAPADKAVVYFVRTSGLGFAINFTYIDSVTLIAKANGTNYVRYECDPGNHLFWARSENRDFVEAELEAVRSISWKLFLQWVRSGQRYNFAQLTLLKQMS